MSGKPSIEAVIFDMDGVLADTEPIHIASFEVLMKHLHLTINKSLIHSFVGHSIRENIATLINTYQLKDANVEELVSLRNQKYIELLQKTTITPSHDLLFTLKSLQHHRIRIALASSSPVEQIEIILNKLGREVKDCFSVQVGGNKIANKKPAPDIYIETLRQLNLPPESCIAVEDSLAGITSAQKAGIFCTGYANVYISKEALEKSNKIIYSLQDILPIIFQTQLN